MADRGEMVAEAQRRALAAIAALKEQRLAEGHTEADLTLLHATAEALVIDRLTNNPVIGATKSGRVILDPEYTSPVMEFWSSKVTPSIDPTIKGGPWQGE